MRVVDYHGFKLEDALTNAHTIIGAARMNNNKAYQEVEFITGHGVIKQELITLLQSYGLRPSTKIGNTGCIIVTIE